MVVDAGIVATVDVIAVEVGVACPDDVAGKVQARLAKMRLEKRKNNLLMEYSFLFMPGQAQA
jgi:hypothetical protein